MRTRIVHTKIWREDTWFRKLDSRGKLIWIHLLSNPQVNIIHCFEMSSDIVAEDTKIDQTITESTLSQFEVDGKIIRYRDYVYLVNAHKYEKYTGERNECAKKKLIAEMSDDVRSWYEKVTHNLSTELPE